MGFLDWLFSMHHPEYQFQNDDGIDAERCALCGIYKTQDPSVAYCSMCGLSFCTNCRTNYPQRVKTMMLSAMGGKVPYG